MTLFIAKETTPCVNRGTSVAALALGFLFVGTVVSCLTTAASQNVYATAKVRPYISSRAAGLRQYGHNGRTLRPSHQVFMAAPRLSTTVPSNEQEVRQPTIPFPGFGSLLQVAALVTGLLLWHTWWKKPANAYKWGMATSAGQSMTEAEAAALARWYALPASERRSFASKVLERNPMDVEAAFALYEACDQMGDQPAAKAALQACLVADPNHAAARHLLSALGELPPQAVPPAGYVASLFDGYAPNFDHHLTEDLKYDIPAALFQALSDATGMAGGAPGYFRVVDAGCGTGLSGLPFRPLCQSLIGIDLSSGMLAQAAAKEIYDDLLHMDLVAGLQAQALSTVDLIVCADTLMYVGDLAPFFDAATAAGNDGCRLAISVESLECAIQQCQAEGRDPATLGVNVGALPGEIILLESGRYAHADAYVLKLAAERGWEALLLRDVVGRYDGPKEVWATLYVFVKHQEQ